MKFIHLSDLHIGRKISGISLCDLQAEIFELILNYINNNNIDFIIISGDVYDKPIPTVEAVTLFDKFITDINLKNIPVFIISGNHDSPERLQFANHILEKNNIHISCSVGTSLDKFTLSDNFGKINIYSLPFARLSAISALFKDSDFNSLNDAIAEIISNTPINTNERNIIIYHGFVINNSCFPEVSDSEIQLGGLQSVNSDIFSVFDYTALGHIHKPQSVGENIRYSGSILKYSFSESNHNKSFTVVDMQEKGNINIKTVPLVPSKDMITISGLFEDIMKNYKKSDDFIRIELDDNEKVPFAMERLRNKLFPNIMELIYKKEEQRIYADISGNFIAENRPVIDIVKDFFLKVYNEKLEGEKENILKEICTEVENETN